MCVASGGGGRAVAVPALRGSRAALAFVLSSCSASMRRVIAACSLDSASCLYADVGRVLALLCCCLHVTLYSASARCAVAVLA